MIAKNLSELFFNQAKCLKNKVVFKYKLRRNEPYRSVKWHHAERNVYELLCGLIELGLKKDDKVAILSDTRYEWTLCDLAILTIGGVVVPIYPSLPETSVGYILNDSQAKIVILENKGQLQKIRGSWHNLPHIKYAIVIDDFGDIPKNDPRIITLKDLKDKGKLSFSKNPNILKECFSKINTEDIATIIYTSGTTGNPKGVILTHKNILSVIEALHIAQPVISSDKYLSFLPLSHVFERVGGQFYALSSGSTIYYCSNIDQIGNSLKDSGATIMLVVPRILEKIHAKLNVELTKLSGFKKKLFNFAFSVSKRVLWIKLDKKYFSFSSIYYFFLYYFMDFLVLRGIRKKIAPQLKYFISGGAPLSKEIAEYFYVIGIPIIEGYGLTETTAPACVNRKNKLKLGTVGITLPNVEIKIASDGEILFKGPTIFSGYYNNEKATTEAFEDGWFKTGDIGELDSEGFLKITDRKKDIIVNSSGKNIAPQNIENVVKTSPYINNIVVIGDKKKYLSALVTLDFNLILEFAKNHGINESDTNTLSMNPEIIKMVSDEIRLKTVPFADYEQIVRFTILAHDFTIDTGELTPTLKVKRRFVQDKYKDLIEKMYP